MADWTNGTITLTSGSANFTVSVAIPAGFRDGDLILHPTTGATLVINTITEPARTAGTLTSAVSAANAGTVALRLRPQADGSRATAKAIELIDKIGNGMLAGLTNMAGGAADKLAYMTGATTWATVDFKSWARSFIGAVDKAAARTALDLGTVALKNIGGVGDTIGTYQTIGNYSARQSFAAGHGASTGVGTASGNLGNVMIVAEGSGGTAGAAAIAFHRPGAHASYLGLDTDNTYKVGGWSMGASAYRLLHEGLASATFTGAYSWSGDQTYNGAALFKGAFGVGRDGAAPGGIYFSRAPDNPFMMFSYGPVAAPVDIAQIRASGSLGVIGFTNTTGANWGVSYQPSTNTVGINTNAPISSHTLSVNGVCAPRSDNAFTLGASGYRWSAVWTANGTLQTSDERLKDIERDIDPATATAIIEAVDPMLYRWKVGGIEVRRVEDGFEEEVEYVTETVDETITEIVMEEGQAVERTVTRPVTRQKMEEQPVFDGAGRMVMEEAEPAGEAVPFRAAVIDKETGDVLEPPVEAVKAKAAVMRQKTTLVPVTQIKRTPRYRDEEVQVPGARLHAGFSAQQIKAALDANDMDCGAWGLVDKDDPDSEQFIRPDQLIPILWAALKDMRAQISSLQASQNAPHAR